MEVQFCAGLERECSSLGHHEAIIYYIGACGVEARIGCEHTAAQACGVESGSGYDYGRCHAVGVDVEVALVEGGVVEAELGQCGLDEDED